MSPSCDVASVPSPKKEPISNGAAVVVSSAEIVPSVAVFVPCNVGADPVVPMYNFASLVAISKVKTR